MGSGRHVVVNLAKVLLLLVNMAFMVSGCLLVYFSHRVRASGWLEAFKGDYAWVGDSTLLFMLVLGAVVISLSALGCFGAWLQSRVLLLVYAVLLVIAAALFVVVAVGASKARGTANDWAAKAFPAASEESSVGGNFNRLYCYAQVKYYCEAPAAEIVQLLGLQGVPPSVLGAFSVTNLCQSAAPPEQLQQLCDVCKAVAQYANYVPVSDWASTSCPRTAANQGWCAQLLLQGKPGEVFSADAPYAGCRGAFLELVAKWTGVLLAGAIVVSLTIVAMLGFACLVRNGTQRYKDDESFIVDSPSPRGHARY
ncbi:hypothetical protein ATCC90586_009299 [Pythium insidiosum]|nr:hypothetical protein ATCC90586_009299 [Pythium insidiosum]